MNTFRSLAALFACVSLFVTGCSVGSGQEGLGNSVQALSQDDCPQNVSGSECPGGGDDGDTAPFPGGTVDQNDDGDENTKGSEDTSGGDCPPGAAPVVICGGVVQTGNSVRSTSCSTACVPQG